MTLEKYKEYHPERLCDVIADMLQMAYDKPENMIEARKAAKALVELIDEEMDK